MKKFEHIKDKFIKEALEEYKAPIDAAKPDSLSVSEYRVEKPWGHELWLELNEFYAYKIIFMKAGNRSSLQSHEKKIETNFVIEGEAEVILEKEDGTLESKVYKAGEGWCVPVNRKHRVCAVTDYKALECSTAHLNDCLRFEDDSNRESGKINSEHE